MIEFRICFAGQIILLSRKTFDAEKVVVLRKMYDMEQIYNSDTSECGNEVNECETMEKEIRINILKKNNP